MGEPIRLVSGFVALLAGAISAGPDTWMEAISFGATVIGSGSMRALLIVAAVAALIIAVWPVSRRRR